VYARFAATAAVGSWTTKRTGTVQLLVPSVNGSVTSMPAGRHRHFGLPCFRAGPKDGVAPGRHRRRAHRATAATTSSPPKERATSIRARTFTLERRFQPV